MDGWIMLPTSKCMCVLVCFFLALSYATPRVKPEFTTGCPHLPIIFFSFSIVSCEKFSNTAFLKILHIMKNRRVNNIL